ncbi:MAG TPA: Gp19/Gp15/Gp42 family protein [Propionibacteriaceae bacterium]|jgi:hypothetical protein
MPDVYATHQDVADRWRPLTSSEKPKVITLLLDASLRVRRRFPTLEARLTSGELDPREVTAVVAGMVKRAMLSGGAEGVTQYANTGGPFTESRTYANPAGSLEFTADDLAVLSESGTSRRAFSVDLTPQPAVPYRRDC